MMLAEFPQWFGSLGAAAYSLFQIMTLEGWSDGLVRPIMEKFPYAWVFFIPFIVVTSFAVLNLFIGIIVSAMQTEHDAEEKSEHAAYLAAMRAETAPLVEELRALRSEVSALRQTMGNPRGASGV